MKLRATLMVAALVSSAVLGSPSKTAGRAVPDVDPATVNVLFILIDTLRADHLSAYGYERETSPVIDALASSGVRFAHVRSQASWTKNSMSSLWTGAYPVRTGVLRFQHGLPAAVTMPAEILKREGFFTAGVWRNGWISNKFGFAQGFDVYYKPAPTRDQAKLERRNPSAHPLLGTDMDITESAREFFRINGKQRFFLYLHYMDVHQYVYDQTSALFGVDYMDAYDNAIHWVDSNIGALIQALVEHGLLDHTLIVLAADHGEAFFEHRREGHARDVYREVTEPPLILRLPGLVPAGTVVEPLVQNVDIWPTILDLLGLPPLESAQGKSLKRLMNSGDDDSIVGRPAFAHMDRTWGRRNAEPSPLIAVTEGRYRLIRPLTPPGEDELYDRVSDPGEKVNLAQSNPERVAQLGLRIDEYLKAGETTLAGAEDVEVDEATLERLRALGYLHDRGGAGNEEE